MGANVLSCFQGGAGDTPLKVQNDFEGSGNPLHAKEKQQKTQKVVELLLKHFEYSSTKNDFVTATEITASLQALYPKMNLYPTTIGKALNKLGFKRVQKKVKGVPLYGYLCKLILPPTGN